MTKVQNFDVTRIMHSVSNYAPFVLMVLAFLSFFAVGVFWVDYYKTLFAPRFGDNSFIMAILIGIIQEAVRFGLLVASMRDFTDDKRFNGWLGLIGSIGLVWHDMSVCKEVAKLWNEQNSAAYSGVIMFLILVGLILEARLILTMAGRKKEAEKTTVTLEEIIPNGTSKNGSMKKNFV
jgi:hypothetical protein